MSRHRIPRRARTGWSCASATMTVSLAVALGSAAVLESTAARADYIDHFATRDDVGILKVPHEGAVRVLVLPVIIDDLPFLQGDEAAFLDEIEAFFDVDARGWAFTPYWETVSLGRYRPEATVGSPIHFPSCPPLGAYADCAIPRGAGVSSGDLQGAGLVIRDAMSFLDEIVQCATDGPGEARACTTGGGVDLGAFDTSGLVAGVPDGVVDGVLVVSNARFPGIALPVRELATNQLMQFFGPFPAFVYGDVTVGGIAIAGAAAPPQRSTWVSVHEFGHLLGFADLYDETGATTDMPYTLMGGWSYDTEGSLLDAFSRIAIGWGHVVQAAGPGTFTLGPADTHGTALKVGAGDEFFLVELRRKVQDATDGDLSVDHGVVVERVRLQRRPSPGRGQYLQTLAQCVNCTPFDTFLSIEQADGRLDLEAGRGRNDARDMFFAGGSIAPSTDTAPRSLDNPVFSTNQLDGAPTGITIRVVETSPDSATIEVDAPPVDDPCAALLPWCPDLPCTEVDGGAECGRVPTPVDGPFDDDSPADGSAPDAPAGCGCAAGGEPPSAPLLTLGLALVVRRAARRRATGPRGCDRCGLQRGVACLPAPDR